MSTPRGKRKPLPVVPLTFDDGEAVSVPLEDIEAERLRELSRLLKSDAPHLRAMGARRLAAAAGLVARAKLTSFHNQTSDKARKVSPLLAERIRRQYDERVHEGRKYGAIKELARIHDLDESTIRAAVAPPKKRIRG